jgi:hypothetical protein
MLIIDLIDLIGLVYRLWIMMYIVRIRLGGNAMKALHVCITNRIHATLLCSLCAKRR